MKKFNRRNWLRALPLGAAATLPLLKGQQQLNSTEGLENDLVTREIDILAYPDGCIHREMGQESVVPLVHKLKGSARSSYLLNQFQEEASAPQIFMPAIVEPGSIASVGFNVFLPAPEDDSIFALRPDRSQPLLVRPSPAFTAALASSPFATNAGSNEPDGTVEKKENWQICRFEAYGIIHNGLTPTCVAGNVEGIWIKLDVLGWLIGSFNRWKTYAEGSLGKMPNQPGQYTFFWTKPNICSSGGSNYQAVYNGILKMLQDLVKDVLGSIGKVLDDLLHASPTIAAYLANALIKWIGTPTTATGTFDVAVNPKTVTVRRGQTANFSVQVTTTGGFAGGVALSASGRTGSTVSFSRPLITGGGASQLAIRTSSSSPIGSNQVTIQATSGSVRKEVPITLIIQA